MKFVKLVMKNFLVYVIRDSGHLFQTKGLCLCLGRQSQRKHLQRLIKLEMYSSDMVRVCVVEKSRVTARSI